MCRDERSFTAEVHACGAAAPSSSVHCPLPYSNFVYFSVVGLREVGMFKKASKHISRAGTTPVKVLFSVEVKTVALKGVKDLIDGRYFALSKPFSSFLLFFASFTLPDLLTQSNDPNSTINVCFERSGKLAATKDVFLSADGDLLCANFEQSLSLVVTLYKSTDGSYQEKTGKLIVRQPKMSLMGGTLWISLCHVKKSYPSNSITCENIIGTTFRGVGIVGLDLHEIVSSSSMGPKKCNLQLSKCPEGSGEYFARLFFYLRTCTCLRPYKKQHQ